jgi:hypothetical protein
MRWISSLDVYLSLCIFISYRYLMVCLTHDFKLQLRFSRNFFFLVFLEIGLYNSRTQILINFLLFIKKKSLTKISDIYSDVQRSRFLHSLYIFMQIMKCMIEIKKNNSTFIVEFKSIFTYLSKFIKLLF